MGNSYASIALIAVLVLLMYFVVLRPQRKRQQKQQETLRTMEPGTRVMTTSGIYATVVHVGEKQMVLETSPGVEITVLKAAVAKMVPEGEEDEPAGYEVDDETDQLDAGPDTPEAGGSATATWPPTSQPGTATEANVWSAGTESSSESAELADQRVPEPGETHQGRDDEGSSALGSTGDSSLTDDTPAKRD